MTNCEIQYLENRLFLDSADDLSIGLPSHISEGKNFSLVYTVPPIGSASRIKHWSIDWGDGTTSSWNKPSPPAHRYDEFGLYSIFIEATPRGQGADTQTVNLLADVENIKPSPSVSCVSQAVPNQPLSFYFHVGDSAPKSHLVVSWSISSIASLPYTPADESVAQSFNCTFSTPGKHTIQVKVRDGDNAVGTFSKTLIVTPVTLQPDATNRSRMNLVAGGTDKNDVISFQNRWAGVEAFVNGVSYGVFKPSGKIIAYGGRGHDIISADASVPFNTLFVGQDGNDTLSGGAGVNILLGGSGKNVLNDPND